MGEWLYRRVSYLRTPWFGVAWGLADTAIAAEYLAKSDSVGYWWLGGGAFVMLLGLAGRWKTGSWRRQDVERRTLDDLFR